VVETKDAIYLIETKKEMDIESTDVQEKVQAAIEYCKHATAFTIPRRGKPWEYIS
jgi:type III restriction enzyme